MAGSEASATEAQEAAPPDEAWWRQFLRFQLVTPIGFVLGWAQYRLIWWLNPLEADAGRAASTWIVEYLIGMLWLHELHRRITFRNSVHQPYLQALGRMYLTYGTTVLIGAGLFELLAGQLGWPPDLGWFTTKVLMAIVNFVALRKFALVQQAAAEPPAH